MDLRMLAAPFPASDVEWRVQSAGEKDGKVWARVLAYIDNRAIMERLDEVCGPERWRNEFRHEANGAVLCGISIFVRAPDREPEWVTKWDGAENTDIESVKGGLSNAMKRAGVQWGIGRYLYEIEEGYANVSASGAHYQGKKDGKYPAFKWDPPKLPAWALPGGSGKPGAPSRPTAATAPKATSPTSGGTDSPTPSSKATPPATPTTDEQPDVPPPAPRNSMKDEDRTTGGRRLGDHTTAELNEIIRRKKGQPAWRILVDACQRITIERALGEDDDSTMKRVKAAVAAEDAALPFK